MNKLIFYSIVSLVFVINCSSIIAMNTNQDTLNKQLIDTITNRDLTEIQKIGSIDKLLKQGADINSKFYGRNIAPARNVKTGTSLVEAARLRQKFVVGFLLSKPEIDINAQNDDGHTALIKVSINTSDRNDKLDLAIAKILLDHNAKIDMAPAKEGTIFHHLAISNKIDIMDLILEKINSQPSYNLTELVNMKDAVGDTALHKAILFGFYNMCKKLLEAGANPNIENLEGISAIALAEHYAQRKVKPSSQEIFNLIKNWKNYVKQEISKANIFGQSNIPGITDMITDYAV